MKTDRSMVCEFLRGLGVRWFMPGKLGEVVPERKTIKLPAVNKTVVPDSHFRSWMWNNYSHRDKLITSGAYTSYKDTSDRVGKFTPNVAIKVSNSGRPTMNDPEHWTGWSTLHSTCSPVSTGMRIKMLTKC